MNVRRTPVTIGGHRRRGPITADVVLLAILTAALLVAGCGDDESTQDGRPLVVTTVPIIYSLTVNVAGDDVRIENLLAPGTSPHQVSFDPGQARLVAEADLLVMNGAGLEFWATDLVEAAGNPNLIVLEASKGIDFLTPADPLPVLSEDAGGGDSGGEGDGDGAAEEGETHLEDEHDTGGVDPHVWLDVDRAQQMVATIRNELIRMDPENADAYEERSREYLNRLELLGDSIRESLSGLESTRFVSYHSAFQYYAQAYGLDQVAVIAEFPGREPSPQYLAQLVELVRALDVPAVLTEPQFSSRPAETLAREAGVETYEVDPEGAELTPEGYEQLMRRNTEVFVEALGGGE